MEPDLVCCKWFRDWQRVGAGLVPARIARRAMINHTTNKTFLRLVRNWDDHRPAGDSGRDEPCPYRHSGGTRPAAMSTRMMPSTDHFRRASKASLEGDSVAA